MNTLQMPTAEHVDFDNICAPIEDFEPLPTIVANPSLEDEQPDQQEAPLDGLILAGLVAPF